MKKRSKFKFRTINDLCKHLSTERFVLEDIILNQKEHYSVFLKIIRDKKRIFFNPSPEYKKILKKINHRIFNRIPLPSSFKGGISGESPNTNAAVHCGKKYMLNIDIENFFPNITEYHVLNFLYKIGFHNEPAIFLKNLIMAKSTRFNLPMHTPQGFPTSTAVAAHTLKPIDKKLYRLGKFYNWKHTIFIDNIDISSNHKLDRHLPRIIKIINTHGFKVNKNKTHACTNQKRMIVTSKIVNKKPNIPKEKRNSIKGSLRQLKKYGASDFLSSKGIKPSKENIEKLKNRIYGKISSILDTNRTLGYTYRNQFTQIKWY